jgi:hypothetical protein
MHRNVCQADATFTRGGRDRIEHRVNSLGVGRVAMQIVKFADRRIARSQHLAIGLPRDGHQCLRADAPGEFVHPLAPRPEIVASGRRPLLGVPSQRTLECVAVRIAETGNHATKLRVTFDRRLTWFDAGDAATVDSQSDIVGPTARQQGFAGNQRGH